ncbi:DEAD-box type RNA helicase, partial [Ceratobasidium sp. 394]
MARQVDPRSAETRNNVLEILEEARAAHYDPKRDPNSESKMELTYSYVLAQEAQHWYCSKASEMMRECALLLQKLHGYRSDAVQKWKDIQSGMIHRCFECAQAYEFSKQRLREVYLSAFEDSTLDNFADAVNQWEQERAMKWVHDGKEYDCGFLQFVDFCLRAYSTEIWANNAANYPDAVLATIVKGDRLEKVICAEVARDKDSDRSFLWMRSLLLGVRDRPRLGNRFQAVFGYLIGLTLNRQLPEHVRILAIKVIRGEVATLLDTGAGRDLSNSDDASSRLIAVCDAVLKYKTELASAAFKTGTAGMRDIARGLLGDIFAHDLKAIQSLRCTLTIARSREGKTPAFASRLKEPVIHIPLWTEALQRIDPADASSLQFMAHFMARSAHIDALAFSALGVGGGHEAAVRTLGQFLESSLRKMRHGFGELMARFGLVCEPERLDASMMTDTITLLFSPVPELHNAALEIFGDCDGRKACLRFALTHQPQATLRGVMAFVDAFNATAGKLVEACSAAKSLVRCFVDVIEALCGPERSAEPNPDDLKAEDDDPDAEAIGLLDDPSFDPEARAMLRPLWTSMCSALALIFS